MLTRALDDDAFRILASLKAGEEGFYAMLDAASRDRARSEGWTTRDGLLTELGDSLLLAEEARRASP